MTTPPTIPLVVGETYYIVDWYGELGFEATYLGLAKDDNSVCADDVLVFKRPSPKEGQWRFAGVIPEVGYGRDIKSGNTHIGVHLRASYYGATVSALRHVNQRELPQFTLSQS